MMMKMQTIPGTELRVSAICYGAAPFGTTVQGEQAERLFGQYRAAGGNFFDTAHCYCFWLENGNGTSERALGEMVRRHGIRDQVVIATKGGHPAAEPAYPRPDRFISAEMVARDLDESLARLDMDHADLYYLHRDDARLPAGEIIEILNAEVRRGRIRYPGASNWRTARIAEANAYAAAHGLQGFAASQPMFNLAHREVEVGEDPTMRHLTPEDLRWHEEAQLPVVAYTSTAGGYFAATPRPENSFDNAISRARRQRALQLAAELGCTPSQLALAFVMSQPFPAFPIIGTVDPEHLADALEAPEVSLTREQVRWLYEG
ncbi:MAG: aldo/keto reductase [Armatimonadota bacterium]